MIYKERMVHYAEAKHNFRIYRVVRLLHALEIINDKELIFHEEFIWNTKSIALDIDWKNYRMTGGNEIIQF